MKFVVLDRESTTERKVRYICTDCPEFKLYIPQSSLPNPWPDRIQIRFDPDPTKLQSYPSKISCLIKRAGLHSKTVHYFPDGDPKTWLIGEPYIPFSLLPEEPPSELSLIVSWT